MNINYIIREYREKDCQSVSQLFNDFQDYLIGLDTFNILKRSAEYGTEHLKKTLSAVEKSGGKFFVCEIDGVVTGFIAGIVENANKEKTNGSLIKMEGEVIELYLDPHFRSHGMGTELMNKMEQYFKKEKCDAIFIDVFVPNMVGAKFYEKHGYMPCDTILIKKLN